MYGMSGPMDWRLREYVGMKVVDWVIWRGELGEESEVLKVLVSLYSISLFHSTSFVSYQDKG